jgi:nucleoside-diphosphate-sugar epimerase
MSLLDDVTSEGDLEERLSAPNDADVACCRRLDGDVLILGAAGKMGPSLARRIVRAISAAGAHRRVIAASRFSAPDARRSIEAAGATALAVDLLDPVSVQTLPECANILFLAGRKFGSTDHSSLTWATNTIVPANVARRFPRSRIVVFSTGNVYPFVPAASQGCSETDALLPRGEYAQSCLGRERVFEYYSQVNGTRVLLFRLNYAVDLRYGVLVDIARAVKAKQSVDRTVSHFNVIWQGDANSYALRSLEGCASPARPLNVTGAEKLAVIDVAEYFGRRFGAKPQFRGTSTGEALLSDARACHAWLGAPEVSSEELMDAVANWIDHGGRTLDKPTHFETADGRY